LLIHIRKTKSEEWKYLAPELKRHGREGKGRRRRREYRRSPVSIMGMKS
jgi:hypothetical protein